MAEGWVNDGKSRAQSSPIAIVLIIGLVAAGTTVTLVIGGIAITNTQGQLGAASAENTLTQLDSQASLVALGASDTQEVNLGSSSRNEYRSVDGGQMTVSVNGTPILQEELGSVVYESESGTKIAYQGGGVWRGDGDGNSVMVSPPELHYRNKTLTLPLITVDGDSSLGSRAVITRNNSAEVYPNKTQSRINPIIKGQVEVTIQSEYHQAWAAYLRSRTDGGVFHEPKKSTVTLKLKQQDKRVVKRAVSIGGSNGELEIQSGNQPVIVASYDSSTLSDNLGPNSPPTKKGGADVQTTIDIKFNGNGEIEGDLTTGGEVSGFGGSGQPKAGIDGNLRYGGGTVSTGDCDKYVSGWCNNNASVDQPETIDNEIDSTISRIQSENNNSETDCLSAVDGLKYGGGSCGSSPITLGTGDYYVSNSDFQVGNGQKLILDTRSGDINIALDSRALDVDGNVTVLGDGRVSVYTTDQVKIDDSNSKVWNRGWDGDQFWVYCDAGCEIAVQKGIFNGVIYAPPDPGGSNGDISIKNGAQVYGAITAGGESTAELKANSEVHFDESLQSSQVFQRKTVPSISYLHITVNRIDVSGS